MAPGPGSVLASGGTEMSKSPSLRPGHQETSVPRQLGEWLLLEAQGQVACTETRALIFPSVKRG